MSGTQFFFKPAIKNPKIFTCKCLHTNRLVQLYRIFMPTTESLGLQIRGPGVGGRQSGIVRKISEDWNPMFFKTSHQESRNLKVQLEVQLYALKLFFYLRVNCEYMLVIPLLNSIRY